jgi:hypothetical protein
VCERDKIDFDASDELQIGVAHVAGEGRVRHVYASPGELARVRSRWTERLDEEFAVLDRGEVVRRGWFGPEVAPPAAGRIGDLVVVARRGGAIVRRASEARLASMRGYHGALTADEVLVPLLEFRN